MNADPGQIGRDARELLAKIPSAYGGSEPGLSPRLKKVTDANVLAVINAGGNGMPAYADMLNDEEKADVVAYLKTL